MPPLGKRDHAVLTFDFHKTVNYEPALAQPRPNVWKVNIPDTMHSASLVDCTIDPESSIETAWHTFRNLYLRVTAPHIPCIISRGPRNPPPSFIGESKYVGRLIKASNERKLERELCVERKAQKEIEAESDLCNNKESFVTSAYKSKLSELRALVEKRKEEEEREKVMDVCKQDGLGGFYRFMFDNQDKTSAGYSEEFHHRTTSKEDCLEADSNSASTVKKQTVKEHTRKKTDVIIEQYDNDNNDNSNKNVSLPSPNKAFPNCDDDDGVTESDRKDDKTRASHQSKKDLNTYLNKKNKKSPGIIMARLRVTTDEELIAARQRYLDRKAAGIHAVIVESD
ncbi:unnamed protein product [Schistosoma mattheei]|uniref:Uncharacterized protein n=1 Tax=Schistosoma mattheei TaxID=31246 RepID=A0A183NWM9_9TREM|nr:unnamed protein product [Schistosoma mattheei]